MKRITFLLLLSAISYCLFAQNSSDPIIVKKSFGTVFKQNGKTLTPRQLAEITQTNPEAFKEMRIAKNNLVPGNIIGGIGGFMLGWPIGTAIGGGKPNWMMAGIGAGLIAVSIPFSIKYLKHAKKAVTIYNDGLKPLGLNTLDFKIGLTSNGLGVKMTF